MRRVTLALSTFLFVGSVCLAQSNLQSELRFVEQMQKKGYAELAQDYLQKHLVPKYPTSKILKLELAKAQISVADEELNLEKRLTMLKRAKSTLQAYLNDKGAPNREDATFQLAQVSALQGRGQLRYAQSLTTDDSKRQPAMLEARKLLGAASKQVEAQIAKLSGKAKNEARITQALLMVDEAKTWSLTKLDEVEKRGKVLAAAQEVLKKLVEDLNDTTPEYYVALAWLGRAYQMNAETRVADQKFAQVLATGRSPVGYQGRRLTYYFQILGLQERAEEENKPVDHKKLVQLSTAWIRTYGKRRSPELYGMLYVLANQNFELGLKSKVAQNRANYWKQAKAAITTIEEVDNEFDKKATQLKLQMPGGQLQERSQAVDHL